MTVSPPIADPLAFRVFAAVGWLLTTWTVPVFVLGFLVVRWVANSRLSRLGLGR